MGDVDVVRVLSWVEVGRRPSSIFSLESLGEASVISALCGSAPGLPFRASPEPCIITSDKKGFQTCEKKKRRKKKRKKKKENQLANTLP